MSIIILSPESVCKDKSKNFNHQIFYDIFMEKLTFFFIPYKYGAKLILNFELSKFMG